MNKKDDQKVTNEKPISLAPLDFTEALSAVMKVKPQPKPKKKRPVKNKKANYLLAFLL